MFVLTEWDICFAVQGAVRSDIHTLHAGPGRAAGDDVGSGHLRESIAGRLDNQWRQIPGEAYLITRGRHIPGEAYLITRGHQIPSKAYLITRGVRYLVRHT